MPSWSPVLCRELIRQTSRSSTKMCLTSTLVREQPAAGPGHSPPARQQVSSVPGDDAAAPAARVPGACRRAIEPRRPCRMARDAECSPAPEGQPPPVAFKKRLYIHHLRLEGVEQINPYFYKIVQDFLNTSATMN